MVVVARSLEALLVANSTWGTVRYGCTPYIKSSSYCLFALLQDEEEETAAGDDIDLPTDILMLAQSFPWMTISDAHSGIKERLINHLPPFEEASRLCQIYFDHAAWL